MKFLPLLLCVLLAQVGISQTIDGYVSQTGNRGFLNLVQVDLVDRIQDRIIETTYSDEFGQFSFELPANGQFKLIANKDMFETKEVLINKSEVTNGKIYAKFQMERSPGYLFEITLAPKRLSEDIVVEGIEGARIEVYNNTTRKPVLELIDHPDPEFQLQMLEGNHYTILIRKKGYIAKRMEAYVNVEGCILCFEGVGDVRPGVVDGLTEGFNQGTLLANVELEPSNKGRKMKINNIYYDIGKATLRPRSRRELDNVITMLQDNPGLAIEIGSHTDSRGKTDYNQELSERRAQSVVRYLRTNGDIPEHQLIARGYGESELINKCSDNVKCPDAMHQENRRTEMKIIGKLAVPEIVPLAEMKRLEQMDAMIDDLQNEGQISGEELQKIQGQAPKADQESADLKKLKEEAKKLDTAAPDPSVPQLGAEDNIAMAETDYKEYRNRRNKYFMKLNKRLKTELNNNKKIDPLMDAEDKPFNGYAVVVRAAQGIPLNVKSADYPKGTDFYQASSSLFFYMGGKFKTQKEAIESLESLAIQGSFIAEFVDGRFVPPKEK